MPYKYRPVVSNRQWHMVKWPCGAEKLSDEPVGYVSWHVWAQKKLRSHKQIQCEKCGLWHFWEQRPGWKPRGWQAFKDKQRHREAASKGGKVGAARRPRNADGTWS